MNERYFPAGAIITEYPEANMVVGTYMDTHGAPCAIAYRGRSGKPCFHFRYTDAAQRAHHVTQKVTEEASRIKQQEERRAKDAEARRHAGDNIAVGDIFVYSWGWDQTNVHFYEVAKKCGATTVLLQEISAARTETGFLCGEATPLPGNYLNDPIRKRLTATHGSEPFISMDYGIAHKWSGRPVYWSCYA